MIAIPLPFVVALLLFMLTILLFLRREQSPPSAFVFIALCTFTTTVVGLRWSLDFSALRYLQPILAASIPVTAWYCFASAHRKNANHYWHALPPISVALCVFTHSFWQPPLDALLTLLYLGYGIALIYNSSKSINLPEQVRLADIEKALRAERLAGIMLLMSAAIDGALAIDFSLFAGEHTIIILTIGHGLLLPILAIAVLLMSLSVVPVTSEDKNTIEKAASQKLTSAEIKTIVNKVESLFTQQEIFLDPDLTLDRLARKAGIPARQISNAINQVYGRNISQVVNEYRIERAKHLLLHSDKSITQIYLEAGFQTKSNFHREFTRITQQTPSAFRKEAL